MAVLRLVPAAGAPIQVDKDQAIVGREPACDVFVNDGSVSRRHARLERRGAAWFVVDQGSANGTYLDSQRVSDALLRPGQELRFGAVPFKVELLGDMPTAEGTIMAPAGGLGYPAQPAAPPRPLAYPPAAPTPPTPQWPAPAPPSPQWPAPAAPPRPAAPPPPMAPPPPAPRPAAPAVPARPVSSETAPYVAGAPAPAPAAPRRSSRPPRTGGAASVDAPPPAKEGRGPLFWVAAGFGGCLTALLLGAATVAGILYFWAKGPRDALLTHLGNVRAGNLEAAYNGLSDAYRQQVSRPAFDTFVARHPALKEYGDISYRNYSKSGGRAVIESYITSGKGDRETANFALLEENGHWKIAAMEVGADHPEAQQVQGPGGLRMEPITVLKTAASATAVEVRMGTNVAGFGVRPAGDQFAIDLAVDVETTGPDGLRIEGLSRDDVQRFERTTSLETGAVAPIMVPLTLDRTDTTVAPDGTYRVRLRVRDRVGGGEVSQEATFSLP